MTEWNSAQQAGRFVEAYADAVLRLCLTYSLTREDAQDICQDIFLTLLEDNRQFEDGEHEKAFVLRCAINACKDLLKSAGRRRTVPMDQAELVPAPEREDSPLPDAIRALPRHYGAALYLFYYEGYSLDEIARLCACTPAAARKRLSRARKLLDRKSVV